MSTNTSMVLGLGRCTRQDRPPRGSPRHHSQVRYLMTRSNRVALHDPREVSTNLSQITSPEHRTISLHASMEPLATKSSRRWQPPRVTSTPACNTITYCHSMQSLKALSHKDTKSPKCSAASNGWPHPLFIEGGPN